MPLLVDVEAIAYREIIAIERVGLLTRIAPSLSIVDIEVQHTIFVHAQTFTQRVVHHAGVHLALYLPGGNTDFGVNHHHTTGQVAIFCGGDTTNDFHLLDVVS